MKCVMVIDQNLPLGLIANTAAVLAASIGNKFGDFVGEDVLDGDGNIHPAITQVSIAMLRGSNELIHSLREKLVGMEDENLYFVDFCDVAQQSKRYEDYKEKLLITSGCDLVYLGLAIYGPSKVINQLTGSIGLLK